MKRESIHTRVTSSQQLTRDSNFSATRKDALGASRSRSPATRRSVVCGAIENIIWLCLNQLELTGINLLEQIQTKKIQVGEIWRKKIRPSQKDLHLSARRIHILLRIPSYYSQHLAAGSRSCQARLLFDSGSQRTFISQDLAKKIGAQPFKKEELLMSSFGHDKRTKASLEMVRVCLMADGEGIIINALVSPVTSPPIFAHLQDDDLNFPYLKGLV